MCTKDVLIQESPDEAPNQDEADGQERKNASHQPSEGDEAHLMQTPPRPQALSADRFLRGMQPSFRGRVLRCLLDRLGTILSNTRRQIQQVQQYYQALDVAEDRCGPMPDSSLETDDAVVWPCRLLQDLLNQQQSDMGTVQEDVPQTTTSPWRLHEGWLEARRRRTAASSSISGDATVQATSRLNRTCETLDELVDDYLLQDTNVDDRFGILRDLVRRMLGQLHQEVCRHRVLLQLINRRLPLPNIPEDVTEEQASHAAELLRRLRLQLQGLCGQSDELPPTVPMDQSWATEQVPVLGPFAMDVMSFLENGHLYLSSPNSTATHECPDDNDYRPGFDRLRSQPGFRDDMLRARHDNMGETQSYQVVPHPPVLLKPTEDDHEASGVGSRPHTQGLPVPLPVPHSARAPDEALARDGGSIRGVQGMTTKAKGKRVQKQTGKVRTKHKHKKITEGLAVDRGTQRGPKPDGDGEATHRQTEIMGYLK